MPNHFAFTTLSSVALSLSKKVEAELKQMEHLGVISPVDEPTDWCAGMVVALKSDGKGRICIDLTKLKESVQRECHLWNKS